MQHSLVFSRELFYVSCSVFKYSVTESSHEITARQTRTSLRKHDVITVCSMDYLTTQIELVLPTFNFWTIHRIIEYLTLGLLSS